MKKTFSLPVQDFNTEEEQKYDSFLKCRAMIIKEGLNFNKSKFTLESLQNSKDSFVNKPILCTFANGKVGGAHDFNVMFDPEDMVSYEDYSGSNCEHPVGLVPESSFITIENINGENWLVVECLIWKKYAYTLVKDLQKKKNGWSVRDNKRVSVEISLDEADFCYEVDDNNEEIMVINRFTGEGIAVLGDNIQEAIEGANIMTFSTSDTYNSYKDKFMSAYNKELYAMFKKEQQIGTGKKLKVDKSKESLSCDPWGKVNKNKQRKLLMMSPNYKSLVKDVYLLVEDGYEESPSEHLKYPVMQLKDDTFVYNKGGLSSALTYATSNNEKKIINKIKKIQNKLGLLDDDERGKNKRSYAMIDLNKFISSKFSALFQIDENKLFVMNKESGIFGILPFIDKGEEIEPVEEEMQEVKLVARPVFEQCDEEDCEDCDEEVEINETLSQAMCDMKDASDKKEEELACKEKELEECKCSMAAKEEELACKEKELEECKCSMAEKEEEFAKCAKELEECKCAMAEKEEELVKCQKQFEEAEKDRMDQDLNAFAKKENLSEEEVEEFKEKKNDFVSAKEFMKEVTYAHFINHKDEATSHVFMQGGLISGKQENIIDRLSKKN